MLDILINAFTIDQFLIAMAGQFVNEGSAKLTLTAFKALGITILGVALDRKKLGGAASGRPTHQRKKKRTRARTAKKKPTARKGQAQAGKRTRATR